MARLRFDRFTEFLAPSEARRPAPADMIEAFADRVPEELPEFWTSYGLGGFGEGLLWFIDPREIAEEAAVLSERPDAVPFARTAFGNVYSVEDDRVFSTHVEFRVTNQVAPSLDFFGFGAFSNPASADDLLMRDYKESAEARLGTLRPDTCYGYRLALALGGEENVENLEIKAFAVYLAVLSQLLGTP